MAFLEAALFIGILLGSLSSSYIYRWTSATILFAIAAMFALIAVLYIMFFVEESVHNTNISSGKMVRSIRSYILFCSSDSHYTNMYYRNSSEPCLMSHWCQICSTLASSDAKTWTELSFSW